jgi:hypothetical protein
MTMYEDPNVLQILLQNWVPVLVVGAAVVLPICAVITHMVSHAVESWRRSYVDQHRASNDLELIRLKQSMVDKGMSADQIEQILKAGHAN